MVDSVFNACNCLVKKTPENVNFFWLSKYLYMNEDMKVSIKKTFVYLEWNKEIKRPFNWE